MSDVVRAHGAGPDEPNTYTRTPMETGTAGISRDVPAADTAESETGIQMALLAAHEQMRSDQQTTLEWHRWLGVATTVVSGLAWVTSAQASKGGWAAARRLIAILSGVLAIGTGYFGGELVWGRDWFKPSESTPTNETFSP